MNAEKIYRFQIKPIVAALFLALLTGMFYSGSLENETALDDIVVLTSNQYVQSGIKGIPDIFSHDSFYGATQKPATRLGWRYRPLSLVFFAIIHEVADDNWPVYHFFNMMLYFLCGWMIFIFLRRWFFPEKSLMALAGAAAFIILPVHAEVVANIKSADELAACLFSILFLHYLLKWNTLPKKTLLFWTALFFTAALFSKESSIVLAFLAPILLFVQTGAGVKQCLRKSGIFIALTILFLLIRLGISQMPDDRIDITNNPYFLATSEQKLATISWVLLKYLRLMFYPEFLSFDYGYRHINYVNFSHPAAICSAVGHILLLILSIRLILKRNAVGLFLLAYLAGIMLISNLFIDVGPIMADRFLFFPGFFLIAALLLIIERIMIHKKAWDIFMTTAMLIVLLPGAYSMTTSRVKEWKDSLTLYRADLKKVPNSFRVVAFNAMAEISMAQSISDEKERGSRYHFAIKMMEQAYRIYPDYKNMYLQWGMAYYGLGNLDSAEWAWGRLKELWPSNSYVKTNDELIRSSRFNEQIAIYNANYMKNDYSFLSKTLNKALNYKSNESPTWALLGKVYYLQGQRDSARYAYSKALEFNPSNTEATDMMKLLQ